MSRANYGDGQELTYADLNAISTTSEKTFLDLLLPHLLKQQENKVFGSGLSVSRTSATTLSVSAGLAIQKVPGFGDREPDSRLVSLKAAKELGIEVPHPNFDRTDLICVKSILVDGLTGNRRYKELNSDSYTNKEFVLEKEWGSEFKVVMGIEDGSKVTPAVPAGFMALASVLVTAVNGIQNESAINDLRSRFSHLKYDAVVGSHSYCTHATLAAALADNNIVEGSSIYVMSDHLVTAPIVISKASIEIEFAPKVTFTKGGAATKALDIQAASVNITKGRFVGFNGVGECAINIAAAVANTFIFGQRFLNNTTNVNDLGTRTTILAEISE